MSSKTMKAEPQLLPSPPPSPTPSDTSTARDAGAPDSINEAYLTPASSTANKGKGRIVDSPIDSQQSDQDDDSDEYHPNEMETKRIEDVSERLFAIFSVPLLIAYFFFFFNVHNGLIVSIDSSQMGSGGTRTEEDSPGIRVFR